MANIKITVEGPLMDGHKITFKAPCNCDVVEKLDVRYIKDNEQKSKLFTMKDAHGNDLTGLGNLFFKDAYVDVVLDPNSGSAYLQNAGTNAYIEEQFKTISAGVATPVDNLLSDRADLPLSARQGKILNESLGDISQIGDVTYNSVEKILQYYIDNGYLPHIGLLPLIPKMTSNTTPYGEASASTQFNDSFLAWKAFTTDSGRWASTYGNTSAHLQYKFTKQTCVKQFYVNFASGASDYLQPTTTYLQGSNNGIEWTNIGNKNFGAITSGKYSVNNENYYLYYRLYLQTTNNTNTKCFSIVELQMYGIAK